MHTNIYELERLIRERTRQNGRNHRPTPPHRPENHTLKSILRLISLALLCFILGRITA